LKPKLMYIKWADAHGEGGGWMDESDIDCGRVLPETVGWMFEQTETEICLVQTYRADDCEVSWFNRLTIPKGMIVEMREIEIDT